MRPWLMSISLAAAVLLLAGFLVFGSTTAQPGAAADKDKRTINTSGTATVRVKPDSARVFFGVRTFAPTIKAVRAENNTKVKQVRDALAALKVPDLKMKTSDVTVELEESRRDAHHLPVTIGFKVTNSFTVLVKQDDPEQLAATASLVLDTALENGANQVQHIVFFRQDDVEAKRQALSKAVAEAVANAKALATGGNVTLRETIAINGQPQFYSPMAYNNQMAQNAFVSGGESPLVAGDQEITCQVSITCTY